MKTHVIASLLALFICITTVFSQNSKSLSLKEARVVAESILATERAAFEATAKQIWTQKKVAHENHEMRFDYKIFGEKPQDGRSLYISLHGGGQTRPDINDQQWRNQVGLYKPTEGVYVAPRAPTDTWNLWHQNHIDDLLADLIRSAIIMEQVNPARIYLLGYSAGGDGVYQLAPRMADRWAAAAMMAGHPGDAQILNLRNLPFGIYMGGVDEAYQRNEWAVKWGNHLNKLAKLEPGSYIHDVHVFENEPHWMSRKDTIAISWMAQFERTQAPNKVVWIQDDVLRNQFYWLGVADGAGEAQDKIVASINGNTIEIEEHTSGPFYIYLNDELVDLNKRVKVTYKGKTVSRGKVKREESVIRETASRLDPGAVYYGKIRIEGAL